MLFILVMQFCIIYASVNKQFSKIQLARTGRPIHNCVCLTVRILVFRWSAWRFMFCWSLYHWLEYLWCIKVSSLCKQNGLNLPIKEMQWSNSSPFSFSSLPPPPHHHNLLLFLSCSACTPPSLSFNFLALLLVTASRFSLFYHHSLSSRFYCSYFRLLLNQLYHYRLRRNYKDLFQRQRKNLPVVPSPSWSSCLLAHKITGGSWVV
jgi:hypothetical protein